MSVDSIPVATTPPGDWNGAGFTCHLTRLGPPEAIPPDTNPPEGTG